MNIFVYEHITGGGLWNKALPDSLVREGDLMLAALVKDLADLADIELLITRDARLGAPNLSARARCFTVNDDSLRHWRRCLAMADAVWPIAPESGGALAAISESVLAAGKRLLGSAPAAVRLAGSKSATAERLSAYGIPVTPAYRPEQGVPDISGRWLLKPDDGAGCEGIRICRDCAELLHRLDELDGGQTYIAQPCLQGTPASLSLLCRQGQACLLSGNLQRIAVVNDEFHLLGCVVGGLPRSRVYESLAQAIAAAVPELWGYVGVDLLVTDNGPRVLEINPRLTTSYAGLHAAVGINPAARVLALLADEPFAAHASTLYKPVNVHLESGCAV